MVLKLDLISAYKDGKARVSMEEKPKRVITEEDTDIMTDSLQMLNPEELKDYTDTYMYEFEKALRA